MTNTLVNNLVQQLNQVQDGGLWLDESFKKKLELVPDELAFTQPIPGVHSVAELISHILVWRKECLHRIDGVKRDLMESPDNWKSNEVLQKIGWPQLKIEFYQSQIEVIDRLLHMTDNDLKRSYLNTEHDLLFVLQGLVHHDLYHLGQIGITLKLLSLK